VIPPKPYPRWSSPGSCYVWWGPCRVSIRVRGSH